MRSQAAEHKGHQTLPMLAVEDLRVGYGTAEVVHGINLQVYPGEIVCLTGRNGVGKTTLLKAILGLLRPWGGRIWLASKDISHQPPHRMARLGLGYAPQEEQIFPDFTVKENLLIAHLGLDPFEECCERVFLLFPILGDRLSQRAGTLSGGEQRMFVMARALLNSPQVLLLDEISEGLSPAVVETIEGALRECQRNRGIVVLLVEQNISFALRLASRFAVMSEGRLVAEGNVESGDASEVERLITRHITL